MTPSNQQQQPYLPTSRTFPVQNPVQLEPELVKSYTDIANAVNVRTISVFEKSQIVTGERWFSVSATDNNVKRQAYRQVYTFDGATLSFPHNISNVVQFTRIYGTCITDFPDFRPLPYASVTLDANIELNCDDTNINIIVGATSPNVISGIIVLEYLLN